jgi:p-aminobenzoyl-glutamate transporter AbgT
MYALFFKAWAWVPWILGLGTLGWIALALLAPGILNVISPLLKGIAEGVVELWKVFYEGITDILDNWKTMFTALILIWVAANYITWKESKPRVEARTPTVKAQKVAPQTKKEKPAFTLQGWDWFHK